MKTLLFLLPASALPIVVAAAGIALVLGVVRPRVALGFIGAFVLVIALDPVIESLLASLPWWATASFLVLVAIGLVRMTLTGIFGEVAAGHVIGSAVVGAAKLAALVVSWPLKTAVAAARGRARFRSRT
jgi:hypothetical protein